MKRARFFVGDDVIDAHGRAGRVVHVLAGGVIGVEYSDGQIRAARESAFRDKPVAPAQLRALVTFHDTRGSGTFPIYRYGDQPWLIN